ncbi:MAG TPA: 2,3-bisphosphoglycerate-independent phosphoglycerate mutase [Candidatus Krumholzibacteria bacterium]|nr:2,3-bisphosphoglycerate-independent phosphoglycerate mutase [Candidatus Krumholzibacteria bacterium]HPD70658.1 2,3-bisphosphoglycerate-independent phosphoglycerate mutase [Candidatus Krumholzibacteria bacterium]HRY39642.1 2,3-bisphosphoglycerate-independent phosphoglycerate mutase [Candidatus Krumholzibacteria bacterium]
MPDQPRPRLVLCILDGVGYREGPDRERGNAVIAARPRYLESLFARFPHTTLDACGLAVGLPEGQMGNSEVGHLTIGAGRVMYQELVRIGRSLESGEFARQAAWRDFVDRGLAGTRRLHLIGLVSPGGVHSHTDHLYGIVATAKAAGFTDIFVHALLDGRDTDPRSGLGYLRDLEAKLAGIGAGRIATVMGRYYGMDRDKRWDRSAKAWDAIVDAVGPRAGDPLAAIQASYDDDVTDEFVVPVVIAGPDGGPLARVEDRDSVFFWNFRADRARQLTWAFMDPAFEGWKPPRRPRVNYLTMTPYDEKLANVPAVFTPEQPHRSLAEIFAERGIRNLRTAETEKYAHVTYFLNGGREEPWPHEVRKLIPSPKVATYDLQPEMSAPEVAEVVAQACRSGDYDVIIVNFANGDMVGHTGVFDAAVQAVRTLDRLLGEIMPPSLDAGTIWLVTADHGNCDEMVDQDGKVLTQHSLSRVPFIVAGKAFEGQVDRIPAADWGLTDIAPTILGLLGLPKPQEMTGRSIIKPDEYL